MRLSLAAQPLLVTPVLPVLRRVVSRHLLRQGGPMTDEGHGGGVTLIQRLGPAANLNIPLNFLALDGVYGCGADSAPTSRRRDARELPVAIVSTWLVAGTRVAEMGATLLTCKCKPQRPVWVEQVRNSNVAYQSSGACHLAPKPTVKIERQVSRIL